MKTILFLALLFPTLLSAYTFDANVPENIKNDMIGDLTFMATIQGSSVSPLHQQIFGNVDGAAYKNFFESRVMAVGLDSCGNPNAVACVQPFIDSSKIWITNNYIKFSHPQIARLMVVYHESRHTEDAHGNWPHATCPTPFLDTDSKPMHSIWTGALLAGEPACDETVFGSYGSSGILLKNIQKFCTNCNEKVKMDAGMYADDDFKRMISPEAIDQIKKDLYSEF